MQLTRLDILLYSHDGRGLGHASRTIAIGMALRRLYPDLRVLFVSGCKISRELIGSSKLDWLKLPSYETEVIEGKSRGVDGNSGFTDKELGEIRKKQLLDIVRLYRPRLVLSDHTPQGKHRELIPALEATEPEDTRWVLGIRGVVGAVSQVKSELAGSLFSRHYSKLLWYGDSTLLGDEHKEQLLKLYGAEPVECGYVSRIIELQQTAKTITRTFAKQAGTISIPWLGEHSIYFIRNLAKALAELGPHSGRWRLFIDPGSDACRQEVENLFDSMEHCEWELPSGSRYIESLQQSNIAIIYGGYNSLMDVLSMGLPTVVVLREMKDNEQQIHLERLQQGSGNLLFPVGESSVRADQLIQLIRKCIELKSVEQTTINLGGAEQTAHQLFRLLP